MLILKILKQAVDRGASDVIFWAETFPFLKIHWELVSMEEVWILTKEMVETELYSIMNSFQKEEYKREMEMDFSIEIKDVSRFRVNAFMHKKGHCIVFRIVTATLPKFEDLMLPKHVLEFVNRKSGLLLVTWGVGTWKSTTMRVLLDHINKTKSKHIITVEDPIEYVFTNNKSIFEQREVGTNTKSFENGLKYALRQASDVVMVGEMRDLETFRLALRAAETGNLVIATLHTSGAARTVSRIIDMFPSEEKAQVVQQLSESLVAVVWQDLLKRKWGGRVPAIEILVNNSNVSNIIRRGQTHQLNNAIETGRSAWMQPMKKSLEELLNKDLIEKDVYEEWLKFLWGLDNAAD